VLSSLICSSWVCVREWEIPDNVAVAGVLERNGKKGEKGIRTRKGDKERGNRKEKDMGKQKGMEEG